MGEIKLPDYNHSILNLITSILKYYNVETKFFNLYFFFQFHFFEEIVKN